MLIRSLSDALASIYFRVPRGVCLGLDPVREACARAGHPQAMPVIHIAGTNGKGSVSAMTASALKSAGYRVGLFTSPHLCRFAERIQVGLLPVDDQTLTEVIREAVELGPSLSFFETTFLAAMLAFRKLNVDVAVVEVGLGGRLDATNVVDRPVVTAITRIALDHTDKLGPTVEIIAREKAAIAKPGVPMVFGPMADSVDRASRATARDRGATEFWGLGREIPISRTPGGTTCIRVGAQELALRPSLPGNHQHENAAVAGATALLARRTFSRLTVHEIEDGISEAEWPGRLEMLSDGTGDILIDSAHNPDGARTVADYLEAKKSLGQPKALVFGAVADKDWQQMLEILGPLTTAHIYVEPGGRAPAPLNKMVELFPGRLAATVPDALSLARQAVGPAGLIVVAGSIFLAGSARMQLLGLQGDPPVAL